jgi:glycosyltransferase involved in cell wall biosynthesis
MNNSLITVIVPVFKVERYLDKCIESIVGQTYDNLEIILVDDGSPDNCPQMCDDWAKRDGRVRVIHKQNGGLSSARNAALDVMRGEYVTFIDSDDYVAENMVEKLYTRLVNDGSDLAHCNRNYVDNNGLSEDYAFANEYEIEDRVLSKEEALHLLTEKDYWLYVIACSKLYKSRLFDSIRYPLNKLYEDERTTHLLFNECDKISILSDKLYNYYKFNPESITKKMSDSQFEVLDGYLERISFFVSVKDYYAVSNMFTLYTDRVITLIDMSRSNKINEDENLKLYHKKFIDCYRLVNESFDNPKQKFSTRLFCLNYKLYYFFRKAGFKLAGLFKR